MTYDARGRWTRTDRPELLSDRLGYPPERGDEDWAATEAARNEAAAGRAVLEAKETS